MICSPRHDRPHHVLGDVHDAQRVDAGRPAEPAPRPRRAPRSGSCRRRRRGRGCSRRPGRRPPRARRSSWPPRATGCCGRGCRPGSPAAGRPSARRPGPGRRGSSSRRPSRPRRRVSAPASSMIRAWPSSAAGSIMWAIIRKPTVSMPRSLRRAAGAGSRCRPRCSGSRCGRPRRPARWTCSRSSARPMPGMSRTASLARLTTAAAAAR